jgi:uncharacterized membrane protein
MYSVHFVVDILIQVRLNVTYRFVNNSIKDKRTPQQIKLQVLEQKYSIFSNILSINFQYKFSLFKYQAPLPGSRKPSSEQNGYNQYGQSNGSRSGYAASNGGGSGYGGTGYGGGGGYGGGANGGGGYSQKALSVGANQTRKPIRYDAK